MIQLARGYNLGFNKEVSEIPSLSTSAWEQNNLLVCGQTTLTHMPVKSTEKDLEMKMKNQKKQLLDHGTNQLLTEKQEKLKITDISQVVGTNQVVRAVGEKILSRIMST